MNFQYFSIYWHFSLQSPLLRKFWNLVQVDSSIFLFLFPHWNVSLALILRLFLEWNWSDEDILKLAWCFQLIFPHLQKPSFKLQFLNLRARIEKQECKITHMVYKWFHVNFRDTKESPFNRFPLVSYSMVFQHSFSGTNTYNSSHCIQSILCLYRGN